MTLYAEIDFAFRFCENHKAFEPLIIHLLIILGLGHNWAGQTTYSNILALKSSFFLSKEFAWRNSTDSIPVLDNSLVIREETVRNDHIIASLVLGTTCYETSSRSLAPYLSLGIKRTKRDINRLG